MKRVFGEINNFKNNLDMFVETGDRCGFHNRMVGYKKSLTDTKGVTRSRKSKYNGQKKKAITKKGCSLQLF
jgi:hypothetical protein